MLDQLNEATARALKPETSRTLTVATVPSFASGWLIPRLGSLRERHPDLDVRISVGQGRTDFAREDVDVAIRFGRGNYPGLRTDLLMEETFFAVCSAALLNDPVHPLREPADLRHHTLLHEIVDTIPDYITWDKWLAAIGVEGVDTSRGPGLSPHLSDPSGGGLGPGRGARHQCADRGLSGGRPARAAVPARGEGPYQYYVVCPEATAERPSIVDVPQLDPR